MPTAELKSVTSRHADQLLLRGQSEEWLLEAGNVCGHLLRESSRSLCSRPEPPRPTGPTAASSLEL